jgi:hypothetical protein
MKSRIRLNSNSVQKTHRISITKGTRLRLVHSEENRRKLSMCLPKHTASTAHQDTTAIKASVILISVGAGPQDRPPSVTLRLLHTATTVLYNGPVTNHCAVQLSSYQPLCFTTVQLPTTVLYDCPVTNHQHKCGCI